MKNSSMKATVLRGILATSLFIITIGSSLGFYYVMGLLDTYATNIKTNSPTLASNDSALKLTASLKTFNTKNKALADKANLFIIPEKDSQNKIMTDIKKYASDTGLTIGNFSFNNDTNPATGNSYKTNSVTITIASPVNFNNLVKFLSLIENSIPKIQATGISISSSSSTEVKIDPITLRYYVK